MGMAWTWACGRGHERVAWAWRGRGHERVAWAWRGRGHGCVGMVTSASLLIVSGYIYTHSTYVSAVILNTNMRSLTLLGEIGLLVRSVPVCLHLFSGCGFFLWRPLIPRGFIMSE
jgi:hypothetical protein